MNNDTFQHGRFYRITNYGKINLDFPSKGNHPITLNGKGESVWFVGLAWKPAQFLLQQDKLTHVSKANSTPFRLIASNYYVTNTVYVEHNEMSINKRDRVKIIEPFTLKELPLLIGTKTTTAFDQLLKGEKINLRGL